jgi:pyridoxal 5'-phosphate synthase pdxS subunit
MDDAELMATARDLKAPYGLVKEIHDTGKLPVVNFAAGGVATPADAALMMQLGVDGVFVGSGIFKSENPAIMAQAIVKATTHFRDAKILADVSRGLGKSMPGLDVRTMPVEEQLATRGW